MKLNKKGMTLVELIISVALLSIIVGFLFKILLDVKYESDDAGFAIKNQVNRSEIIKTIQYDFEDLGINEVFINSNIVTFKFTEEEKKLEVDDTTIKYDDKKWTIKDNNYIFGEISLDDSIEGYWKITLPVVNIDGTNESSIDDIILFARYKEVKDELPYLKDLIFANTTVVTTTPDFSINAEDENTNLYKAEDDYGTSYYFRGASLNNYVEFAGYYWRVVRINGNGTIRLVYDGTNTYENDISHVANIGKSYFYSNYSSHQYNGYTYEEDGVIKDSLIKENVELWYENDLLDYDHYISDSVFCNDNVKGYENTFVTLSRIVRDNSPVLTCTRKEDRYTVDDKSIGNGLLGYPVGLLTVDEVLMAGGRGSNYKYYLYSDSANWTLSPFSLSSTTGYVMAGEFKGGYAMASYQYNYGIRPVINLKADVTATGTGTVSDPYVVDTE